MTRFRLALSLILSLVVLAVVAVHRGHATAAEPSGAVPARSFEFTYQVHVPANADSGGPTHLWIPLPQADAYQDIRGLRVGSAASHDCGHHPEYGHAFAAFTPTAQQSCARLVVVSALAAARP